MSRAEHSHRLRLIPQEPPLVYEVWATPGWPPVRIPGRPGWWRHYNNGQQVDLPYRDQQSAT